MLILIKLRNKFVFFNNENTHKLTYEFMNKNYERLDYNI